MLLSQKLWLWGRDSSALFSPMVTNREFRALVLKVVQAPETATTEKLSACGAPSGKTGAAQS